MIAGSTDGFSRAIAIGKVQKNLLRDQLSATAERIKRQSV
jgi:hypothetical protein